MPSEIRTSTYPKTNVDLLQPPSGAGGRSGSDGFDNLLRALAPAERQEFSPINADRPAQPPVQDCASSSYDSSSSNYTRRPEEAYSTHTNQPDRTGSSQAASDNASDEGDESIAESQSDPPQGEVAATPSDETDAKAEAPSVDPPAKDEEVKDGDEVSAEVVDQLAQQLAALSTQTPAAEAVAKPEGKKPIEGEVVAELPPATEVAETQQEKPKAATVASDTLVPAAAVAEQPAAVDVSATTTSPGKEQVETTEVASAVTTQEVPEIVAEAPPVEGTESASNEQPIISDLRSTRTQNGTTIHLETPPKQPGEAALDPTSSSEVEPQTEAIDTATPNEVETEVAPAEVNSDAGSQRDDDRKTESASAEKTDPVAEASFEPPAMEAATPEQQPAENPQPTTSESPRQEPTAQHQQQAPANLIDPQARAGAAPRLAAEVLAGGSRETGNAKPVEIDSARFLTRVARAFTAAQQRGGEVQMRLSPPELGSLRVEIKVVEGVMTARVETENASAQTALLEHLPQLRERLAEQGVRIERFDVDLMQHGSSNTPDRPAEQQSDEGFTRRGTQGTARSSQNASSEPRAVAATLSASGGLNVIV